MVLEAYGMVVLTEPVVRNVFAGARAFPGTLGAIAGASIAACP